MVRFRALTVEWCDGGSGADERSLCGGNIFARIKKKSPIYRHSLQVHIHAPVPHAVGANVRHGSVHNGVPTRPPPPSPIPLSSSADRCAREVGGSESRSPG